MRDRKTAKEIFGDHDGLALHTTGQLRLGYADSEAKRAHAERIFALCVIAVVIAAGLVFMATSIPGGKELVIASLSYFAGHASTRRRENR